MNDTPFAEPVITLEEAIIICKELEVKLKEIGYHCGLTGSMLYKGQSTKDIDIIIYPHQVSQTRPMNSVLDHIGARTNMYPSQGQLEAKKIEPSSTDKLIVVSRLSSSLGEYRVDLFFMQ